MLGINPSLTVQKKQSSTNTFLTVVAPFYNESQNIDEFVQRVKSIITGITENFELICVNDGSNDNSLEILTRQAQQDKRIKLISFSRNFGHQIAITAGLEHASGEAVIIIDSDLQDPPELINEMIKEWKNGSDVVYAIRAKRDGESFLKLLTARIFYRLIKKITHFKIPIDTGDFRLMSRRAVITFLQMPERQRYVRGMVAWAGFKQTGVRYNRSARKTGETKYTYKKMITLALDGVTSFSYAPLQLASYLGIMCSLVSFLLIIYAFISKYLLDGVIKGWTSLITIVLFLGGIQLLVLGAMGEYLGRIHSELKRRPLYIVDKSLNFEFEKVIID